MLAPRQPKKDKSAGRRNDVMVAAQVVAAGGELLTLDSDFLTKGDENQPKKNSKDLIGRRERFLKKELGLQIAPESRELRDKVHGGGKPPQGAPPATSTPAAPAPGGTGSPPPVTASKPQDIYQGQPAPQGKVPATPTNAQPTADAPEVPPKQPAKAPVPAGPAPPKKAQPAAPTKKPPSGGKEVETSETPGPEEKSEKGRTHTQSTTSSLSPILGPDKMGVSGSRARKATQERGHGVETSQSVDFGGKFVTNVEPVPNTFPAQFNVTITIDLSATAGLGAGRKGEGGIGVEVSASASGTLTKSFTHRMSKDDVKKYLAAVKGGVGGESDAYNELKVAKLLAKGDLDAAKAYLAQPGSSGSAQAASQMKEGEAVTSSVGGKLAGKVGASGGATKMGVEFGMSTSGQLTRTVARTGGKIRVTIAVTSEKGLTVGGSANEGVAGMGVSREGAESKGKSITFVLDPKDSRFDEFYKEIMRAGTVQELSQLAARKPEFVGASTNSHGTTSAVTTSASIAGFGLSTKAGKSYSEEETVDATGTSHKYEGSGSLGGSLSIAGRNVSSTNITDKFTGEVGPNNKAKGESSSTQTETDYLASLQHPIASAVGLAKGDSSALQEKSEIHGKKLTDESFTRLAELAKDPAAWQHAWQGNVDTFIEWEATRKKVLAANGDRNLISKALAKFEQESGRSLTLENAISETGVAFDFPEELKDQKAAYDELVAGNPFMRPRELVSAGKAEDAIAELNTDNEKLGKLISNLQIHQQDVHDPGALAEMMHRISLRRTEIRNEIHKFAPSSVKQQSAHDSGGTTTKMKQEEASRADAQKQAEAQKRQERNEKINDLVPAMLTNKEKERAGFAVVSEELKKKDSWFSKPDVVTMAKKLTELKVLYEQWDKSVVELRQIYVEQGDTPDRANQFAPNRTEWNELYRKHLSF